VLTGSVYHNYIHTLLEASDGFIYAGVGMYLGETSGVYRTNDGGATWTNISGTTGPRVCTSLLEASDGYIYAGGGRMDPEPEGGVYRTNDGGASWTNISGTTGPETPYSLLEASDGYIYAGGGLSQDGIFLTNDGGATWVNRASGLGSVSYLFEASDGYIYAPVLWNDHTGTWINVYRTNDGGATWANTSENAAWTGFISMLEAKDGYLYAAGYYSGPEGYIEGVLKSSEPINPQPQWDTPFSVINARHKGPSDIANFFFLLCLTAGAVVALKRLRRRKQAVHSVKRKTKGITPQISGRYFS